MIHPHTEIRYVSDEVGHGVFAKSSIPCGTITWVMDHLDREFTPQQVADMPDFVRENFLTYTYRNRFGNFVLLWDHTRYMNHSFRPNCVATAYGFEVAVRDILPGEQMTNDYGWLNILEPFTPVDEGTVRKEVKPDDLKRHHATWDALLHDSFPKILNQHQPLRALISDQLWEQIVNIGKGEASMQSILTNLCK